VGKRLELPFDPIDRAARIWENRFGPSPSMAAVTSIMRAQQILLAELDALLRPYQLTFARYEALVLLTFSRRGALPLRVIGERLMVHPTSVTNIISRLERQKLVIRRPNPAATSPVSCGRSSTCSAGCGSTPATSSPPTPRAPEKPQGPGPQKPCSPGGPDDY